MFVCFAHRKIGFVFCLRLIETRQTLGNTRSLSPSRVHWVESNAFVLVLISPFFCQSNLFSFPHKLTQKNQRKIRSFRLLNLYRTWIRLFRAYCNTPSKFSPLNCREGVKANSSPRGVKQNWTQAILEDDVLFLNTLDYLKICRKRRRVHSTRWDCDDLSIWWRFLQQWKH